MKKMKLLHFVLLLSLENILSFYYTVSGQGIQGLGIGSIPIKQGDCYEVCSYFNLVFTNNNDCCNKEGIKCDNEGYITFLGV